MKKENEVIEDLISKIISIGNIGHISNGHVSMDYRMFCDLISIARCGSDTIKDKKSDFILEKLENNVLTNNNTEVETELMSFEEYKRLKNII
jgi:hypothetical protein